MADPPQDFEPPATPAVSPPRTDENEVLFDVLYDEPMTPYVPGFNEENEETEMGPPLPPVTASTGYAIFQIYLLIILYLKNSLKMELTG